MKTRNSILAETKHGTYYTGPLAPAKRAMLDEYGDSITVEHLDWTGYWLVTEHRGSDHGNPNQWGKGETEEEAWRYLIGCDFGPLDETYEDEGYEAHQRMMLGLPDTAARRRLLVLCLVLAVLVTGLVIVAGSFVKAEGATSSTGHAAKVETPCQSHGWTSGFGTHGEHLTYPYPWDGANKIYTWVCHAPNGIRFFRMQADTPHERDELVRMAERDGKNHYPIAVCDKGSGVTVATDLAYFYFASIKHRKPVEKKHYAEWLTRRAERGDCTVYP